MAYDPPTGQELKACKIALVRIKACDHEIDNRLHLPFVDTISIDHAIEGVRSNGHQQLTTINAAIDDLKVTLKDLKNLKKNAAICEKVVVKALARIKSALKGSRRCSACKGAGGKYNRDERYSRHWTDCFYCDGRGRIFQKVG